MKSFNTIIGLVILLLGTGLLRSQTTSENYIHTKVYLSEDGTRKAETIQYFDGLGRPKQSISVKAAPDGKDLVVPIIYDNDGRQTKDFLPVPMNTSNLGIQSITEATVSSYYGISNPYSEKKLENSPLGRLQEVAHPGTEWAMSGGKTQKLQYDINAPADQVKKFTVTHSWVNQVAESSLPAISTYTPGQLVKNTMIDEDGKTSIEFKNSSGQLVLARKMNDSEKIDTYYIYNIYGQLVYVISPKASAQLGSSGTVSETLLNELGYRYKYDHKNRLVEKKLPGKGWEYMVYDKQNRLVASQDANMKNGAYGTISNQWLFTKYDKLGRVVYTGKYTGGTRQQEVNNVNAKGLNSESRSITTFTKQSQQVFYTNTAYPTTFPTLLSVNYYDTYPGTNGSNTEPMPSVILDQNTMGSGSNVFNVNNVKSIRTLKMLPTASLVKNIEDDNWSRSFIWYDSQTRPIGSIAYNHLGGYTESRKKIDFAGVLLQSQTIHKRLTSSSSTQINERFEYDDQNRLKKHYHQVNGQAEVLLSENTYNNLLQLVNKKVGNNLQSIDYNYNIRGWITKINDPSSLNGKLFGYEMRYTQAQYSGISTGNYNGNVSEIDWASQNDAVLRRYTYQYDGVNRLTKGFYAEPNASIAQNDFYNEDVFYDVNGNILNMRRNRKNNTTALMIDNLSYTYSGNKIQTVNDNSGNITGYPIGGQNYEYDHNGNIARLADKGMNSISYNHLNLSNSVVYDNTFPIFNEKFGQVQYNRNSKYLYRADGTKLKKSFYSKGQETSPGLFEVGIRETEYLDGFQYEGEGSNTTTVTQTLRFVPTAEGYYNFENNTYIYQYKDHLGNVRVSYYKNSANVATILDESNYYPFGMEHLGYNQMAGNPRYRYSYNGKELQDDNGMYDYGARMYIPEIGRWGGIDPLAEIYRRHSPYNYVMNNPLRFTDPDGRGAMDSFFGNSNIGYDFRPMYSTDESGNMRVNPIYSGNQKEYLNADGGGSSTDVMTFTNSKAIAVLQQYFTNSNKSVGSFFDLIKQIKSFRDQLQNANIKPDGKFKFTLPNIDKIITSVEEIEYVFHDVYKSIEKYSTSKKLIDHNGIPAFAATVMGDNGMFTIHFATKYIKTNIDFAYAIFHEFGHVLNEKGMSFSEWSKYINSPAAYKEEISVWKNFNMKAGDTRANTAIKFYENLLNNRK